MIFGKKIMGANSRCEAVGFKSWLVGEQTLTATHHLAFAAYPLRSKIRHRMCRRVTTFWFCSPFGFVFVGAMLKVRGRFSDADVADVVTLAMCGLVRIVPFDVARCRLLAQRASHVRANVQRGR